MVARRLGLDFIILGISIIAYFLFLATAFNSFYWMDDFWIRYESLKQGVYVFQKEMYLNWDGRAFSPLYTVRIYFLYLFDYPYAWVVTMIGMFFLTGTGYFSGKLIHGSTWRTFSINQRILQILLFTFVLVMVFRPHLSRSLYWGTGVYYVMTNFFTFLTVYSLLYNSKKWYNIIFIFITCTSGPNNGLIIVMVLIFISYTRRADINKMLWICNITTGVICVFISTFSPGNFIRGGDSFSWNLISLVEGFLEISTEYLGMSLWAIIGGGVLGFFLDVNKLLKIDLKLPILFIFCSFVSILPFLPLPSAASKHTAIFFQSFLLISIILFIFHFRNKFKFKLDYYSRSLGLILFIFFFTYQISIQVVTGSYVKNQIDKRHEILEANRGSSTKLIVKPISIPSENWVSRFWDFNIYFDCNCNNYYEKYFNTGEIIISD